MKNRVRCWTAGIAASLLIVSGLATPPAPAVADDAGAPSSRGADQPTVSVDEKTMTDRHALAERVDGKVYYRIPSITATPKGDLIVAFDERPLSANDPGKRATEGFNGEDWFLGMKERGIATWKNGEDSPNPNSIKQWRSTDGGRNWTDDGYICRGNPVGDWSQIAGCSDPSYVVDWETGNIFNFHVLSYEAGLQESQPGNDETSRNVIQAHVAKSTDDGRTWTTKTITATVTPDPRVAWRFAASGQGIQIRHGKHAGRLVQQFTRTYKHGGAQEAFSLYSDDGGDTWTPGAPIGTEMDENKVVERSDGSLLMSSRDRTGNNRVRWQAESFDGGATWTNVRAAADIVDGKTNGQPIRAFPNAAPDDPRAKILLFANAQTLVPTNNRHKGTIWMSCDDGQTWPISKVFNTDSTGYATIAVQPDGRIGLVTEDGSGNTKELGIYYRSFGLGWLGSSCASMRADDVTVKGVPGSAVITASVDALGADPTGTVTVENLPAGWTAAPGEVSEQNAGAVTIPVELSREANDGVYDLSLRYTSKAGAVAGASIRVTVEDESRLAAEHIASVWANSEDAVEDKPIGNAFDSDPATFWHSQWKNKPASIENNHEIVITLDQPHDLTKVTYLAPQRDLANGAFKTYEVLVAPLADGARCADASSWTTAGSGTLPYDRQNYLPMLLEPQAASGVRCVKIHVTGEQTAGTNAAAAEIRLYGEPTGEPAAPLEPAIVSRGHVFVDSSRVEAGSTATFTGSGFAAHERITIMRSAVEPKGDAPGGARGLGAAEEIVEFEGEADDEGALTYAWRVDENEEPGVHSVRFVGSYSSAQADVTVVRAVALTPLQPAEPVGPGTAPMAPDSTTQDVGTNPRTRDESTAQASSSTGKTKRSLAHTGASVDPGLALAAILLPVGSGVVLRRRRA
ncbi:exo-alpha-sialidase [Actinomyces sp. B33]|uniref:exo-alpha-sialidase n=1 Tax=Actinomyces sp. B33 TaxID=2942131 RepID=UPI00234289BC|nr:exo-alpha-sialidase [Actinomyces sp. B33]MDC4233134.1 exo-alpha-sialidase [Actinomyces sp. B33]